MIALILLFTGCASSGKDADALALKIRAEYISAAKIETVVNITADYGEKVYPYKLRYTGSSSAGTIEVLEPDVIAGLKATVNVSGGTLHYDGADLDTGALSPDGLSPLTALPVMLNQWQSGFITNSILETYNGTGALTVTTALSDNETQKVWFDAKTHLPIRSEISLDGRLVIACVFEDTTIE